MTTFTRRSLGDITTKTADSYSSVGGSGHGVVLHTPDVDRMVTEVAAAVEPMAGWEHMSPEQRAAFKLRTGSELRDDFAAEALREAREIEAELRAGRPPEPEPLLSEDERMERAKQALSGGTP